MAKRIGFFVVVMTWLVCTEAAYGQMTVSGGFALSTTATDPDVVVTGVIGAGGNISLDWLLPIGIPVSLGFEAGFNSSAFRYEEDGFSIRDDSISAIPLLFRAVYHFDISPKIDPYLVGKIGYVFGIWQGVTEIYREVLEDWGYSQSWYEFSQISGGLGFGFDLGVAYYFTANVGLFAESGFDRYMLSIVLKAHEGYYRGITTALDAHVYRFLTLGLSLKL
jgi:hypothetical protein